MEHSNINIDTNKQWEHARSAVADLEKKRRLAELAYIRELFNEKLPIGEELTEVQSYFDTVEQVINANGDVNNEQFEPEREIVDPETGGKIPYRYYSASLSQQRALEVGQQHLDGTHQGITEHKSSEQDMGHPSPSRRCNDVQDQSTESPHLSHVAERKKRSASFPSEHERSSRDGDGDHDPKSELGCCRTV